MASLPPGFKIAYAEPIDNQAYVASRTRSLIARQRKLTGQAWDFRLRSIALETSQLKPVMAGFAAINRDNDTIVTSLPIFSESNATTATAGAALSRGQYQLTISTVAGLQVGDFFNFAGHPKAYQVTAINGLTIDFAPNVVAPVALGEVLTFNGCTFSFYLASRPQRYPVSSDNDAAEIEIELLERW